MCSCQHYIVSYGRVGCSTLCTLSASTFHVVDDVAFEHSIKKDIRDIFIEMSLK